MTTSACGWPKLSHRHCSRLLRLLGAVAAVVSVASSAVAQSGSSDPFADAPIVNPRPETRHSVSRPAPEPDSPPAATSAAPPSTPGTAAEATPTSHHKTWKELAQKHNEERARQPQTSASSTPSSSAPKSSMSGALSAVGALIVVIGLILVLARLFRRHAPLFNQSLPNEVLEVLGRRYLDQRQSILLLRIGSRILVVGSSPAGLQGIGELSDPVEVDLVAGMCRPIRNGQGLGSSFFNLIKGQTAPTAKVRHAEPPRRSPSPGSPAHSSPPHRNPPRASELVVPSESPDVPGPDPAQELIRRLRGGSSPSAPFTDAPYAGPAEVFRD
jgi:flagellar biogenesis protein FliO